MTDQQIMFVNTVIISWGLIAVMFSLGLSISVADFVGATRKWRAVAGGLLGQLLLLPILGFIIVLLFTLPPFLAVGLLILAASPGGITSNAVVFAAGGNTALSVLLTAITSLVTVISSPFLIQLAIGYFDIAGEVPPFSVMDTIGRLFQMTVLPVALGMICNRLAPDHVARWIKWLRPAAMIVMFSVIGFSIYASADMLWLNLTTAGPAILALNLGAMLLGLGIALLLKLEESDMLTVSVEVGVQNATIATFLTITILGDIILAIVPTLYGILMLANAFLFVSFLRSNMFARLRSGGAVTE